MSDFKISQYVYFRVMSESLSFSDIEEKLEIKADKQKILGEKRHEMDPSSPLTNSWEIHAQDKNSRVDDQIESIIERIKPLKNDLIKLNSIDDVKMRFEIVRYFGDTWGGPEEKTKVDGLEKLPGQHQLLGWYLNSEFINFLADIHADIDVDEYN